ncbi:MAG: retropepsin-like domain-containing protein [Deltaproteobacteria bacterium]|nr:retropepsin-like domain-containing protein [Deltaproteobacteria bacterium]
MLLGTALLVIAVPLVLLSSGTVIGLGLDQNLPGPTALLGALCAVILPAFGFATLFGSGSLAHGLAFCAWSALILTAFPSYFPERRELATRIGLEYLSMSFGDPTRAIVVDSGMEMLSLFGPEPVRTIRAEQRTQDTDKNRDRVRARVKDQDQDQASIATTEHTDDFAADRRQTWIPYRGDGQTIVIPVHVDGPDFGEELQFIFDTGATLTTLSRDTLELLDIPIDDAAPLIMLRTAAGEVEARLALLDAVWLEEESVEWVTVAVCEACASGTVDGLLGLNVSSHFRVSIDHEAEEIELIPRPGRRNRRLDIQPWLEINSVLRRWDDGRLEVTVNVKNRAQQGIQSSVLEVRCSDESFTIRLDPIPAFGSVSQPASLPWGNRCENFEIHPVAATWVTDRF